MAYKNSISRYRRWYAGLLRLYPKPFFEHFGEGMAQTFNDILRERAEAQKGLFVCAFRMFIETLAGIIRERKTSFIMRYKNILYIALATAILLLIPLVAMQFTNEVDWDLFDFAVMGALIFGTGLAYELVAKKVGAVAYRAAVGVALGAIFLLVWVNGAVGIIGHESNTANLMYFGVIAVLGIGAFIARLRPHGMARALFATAFAQMLVPVLALIIWQTRISWGGAGISGVIGLNAFFAMLFVLSALLFRRASATGSTGNRQPE